MNRLKNIIKVLSAGVIAFFVLSFFSYFYYNLPSHIVAESYTSDYAWEKNSSYFKCTEGFAYGRFDSNGYNNVKALDDIDILVMGSSQMEATNVCQNDNTVAKLNSLFEKNENDLKAYNIGISSHSFLNCLNNLKNAKQHFKPKKYIIIEAYSSRFDVNSLEKLSNNQFSRTPSYSSGILYELQKFDYLRLLYSQYRSYIQNNSSKKSVDNDSINTVDDEYKELLDDCLKKAVENTGDDIQLIVFSADPIDLNQIKDNNYEKSIYTNTLENMCKKNNITYINLNDYFLDYYNKNQVLPTGFSNTHIGKGHYNKHGHTVIAEALYDKIMELEAKQ